MTDRQIATIVMRQHGVISTRQLLACGLSAGGIAFRVRSDRLFPILRGVFALSPHLDTWGHRCAAVLSAGGHMGPDRRGDPGNAPSPARPVGPRAHELGRRPAKVILSHWSALDAYGVIDGPTAPHHVTVEGNGSRPFAGVRIHRARTLDPADVRLVRGLPMSTPARAILDAANGASVPQVRRLIREAEYRKLIGVGAIADVVRRNPFHPGSAIVRRADPQTAESGLRQTPIEDRMALVLNRLSLDAPQSQFPATGRSGRPYRADFAWPDLALIVETDGRDAHDRTTAFHSDRDRDADLAAAGWLTLRFTSLQLDHPDRVAATILATARTRDGMGHPRPAAD